MEKEFDIMMAYRKIAEANSCLLENRIKVPFPLGFEDLEKAQSLEDEFFSNLGGRFEILLVADSKHDEKGLFVVMAIRDDHREYVVWTRSKRTWEFFDGSYFRVEGDDVVKAKYEAVMCFAKRAGLVSRFSLQCGIVKYTMISTINRAEGSEYRMRRYFSRAPRVYCSHEYIGDEYCTVCGLYLKFHQKPLEIPSPRDAKIEDMEGEQFMSLVNWAKDPNRKRSFIAFTEGPVRLAAYAFEMAMDEKNG